jgi:hypothetical protein
MRISIGTAMILNPFENQCICLPILREPMKSPQLLKGFSKSMGRQTTGATFYRHFVGFDPNTSL